MDFYRILGVARDATPQEIKKAFREKAKKFHPDINRGSQEYFKKVIKAYEILIDPEKRKNYDRKLENRSIFEIFSEKVSDIIGFNPLPKKGKDINKNIFISIKDGFYGSRKSIIYRRKELCSRCSGTGFAEDSFIEECKICKGNGKIKKGIVFFPCFSCKGRGFLIKNPCNICGGEGYIIKDVKKTFYIPKGVQEGDKIKINKGGHCGVNGGEYGDLYLTVFFSDRGFKIKGKDIYITVHIKKELLKEGGSLSVKNFDEKSINVLIPEDINKPALIKVGKRGYIGRDGSIGDLYIKVIPL